MTMPGHWEGDLITGASNRSAIGTLVDRASRYTILLYLPGRHTAEAVRDALIAAMSRAAAAAAPVADLGPGQGDGAAPGDHRRAGHAGVLLREGQPVAAAERTRTPTGCCASTSPRAATCARTAPGDLAAVAAELNARPRKTLGWDTPAGAARARATRLRRAARTASVPGSLRTDGSACQTCAAAPRATRRAARDPVQARHGERAAARAGAAAGRGRHRRRQHRRARPGHAAAGAQPRHRAAQHGHVHPGRARPRTGRRHHAARRRSHRRRRHRSSPPRSWTRPSPNRRTTPRPPSPAASAWRSACSTSGCPGTTPAPQTGWPS